MGLLRQLHHYVRDHALSKLALELRVLERVSELVLLLGYASHANVRYLVHSCRLLLSQQHLLLHLGLLLLSIELLLWYRRWRGTGVRGPGSTVCANHLRKLQRTDLGQLQCWNICG